MLKPGADTDFASDLHVQEGSRQSVWLARPTNSRGAGDLQVYRGEKGLTLPIQIQFHRDRTNYAIPRHFPILKKLRWNGVARANPITRAQKIVLPSTFRAFQVVHGNHGNFPESARDTLSDTRRFLTSRSLIRALEQ